jgi:16S rRNA (uracil1498-N3)-methyltransferase
MQSGHLRLGGADAHHIADVLRMKEGQELIVCDGARTDLLCRIVSVSSGLVELQILELSANATEPAYDVHLYQGLAKGDKLEQVIQKSVELGVARITPVICRRSVALVHEKDRGKKTLRWNRIAAEAAKQCGRGIQPVVAEPLSYDACLSDAAACDLALVPWEMERADSIRTALAAFQENLAGRAGGVRPTISLIIGPEGGLTEEEVDKARLAGIRPVSLGRRILRTETAGPAVLAMILYQFDEF